MKLPFSDKAFVPQQKLLHYLLLDTHPVGRFKAKFFHNVGFNEKNVHALEQALLAIAVSEDVKEIVESPYGKKYILDGGIVTPNKKRVILRTIWIIENSKNEPSFVTVYPL